MTTFGFSNILQAFVAQAVGTKVTDRERFLALAETAVAGHDFRADRVPGQGFIQLPDEARQLVSCGTGRHTHQPDDYVVRSWRGAVGLFLRRDKAAPADGVAVIVYTREAYLADPDVLADAEEKARVEQSDFTHLIVAVLAFAGPRAPVGYERFVKNLAGGNNEYLPENTSVAELAAKAREVVEYHDTWCTVAD